MTLAHLYQLPTANVASYLRPKSTKASFRLLFPSLSHYPIARQRNSTGTAAFTLSAIPDGGHSVSSMSHVIPTPINLLNGKPRLFINPCF